MLICRRLGCKTQVICSPLPKKTLIHLKATRAPETSESRELIQHRSEQESKRTDYLLSYLKQRKRIQIKKGWLEREELFIKRKTLAYLSSNLKQKKRIRIQKIDTKKEKNLKENDLKSAYQELLVVDITTLIILAWHITLSKTSLQFRVTETSEKKKHIR